MDARCLCRVGVILVLLLLATGAGYAGTQFETANFVVKAPTADMARQFAERAEQCREELALLWLGKTLPDWADKCIVNVHVGNDLGAGGKTSFIFENREVFGWEMEIQGSHERILDSVLPHEITHMILASHFRQPVPRWIDEGIATYVEHYSELANYRRMLRHFLRADVQRGIPFNRLVTMTEYPTDVMPFYAQGFSLVEYLLELGRQFAGSEHQRLVHFAKSAQQRGGDWQSALQEHYGIQSLGELQLSWVEWVGSDPPALPQPLHLAAEATNVSQPAIIQASAIVPMPSTSAKPLPPPPANSVYDRRQDTSSVSTIPVSWRDEQPVRIPTSFGRDVGIW